MSNDIDPKADAAGDEKLAREQMIRARAAAPAGPAGRMATAGMPVERSENFNASAKRLVGRLRPERARVTTIFILAVTSMGLSVAGPKVLGAATNILFDGVRGRASGATGRTGIDFDRLHRVLYAAVALYVASVCLQYLQSLLLAGVVQRTMLGLRAEVEDKLHRLPLQYVDSQPRGDLLSRVTNDIDNISQSLQQSVSMLLTSSLTLVGVLAMMFYISWMLALVAAVTIPASIYIVKFIAGKSRTRFMAQWKHTGILNAHVEEVFTGHALVKAFGRQQQVEAQFDAENEKLYRASFGAQSISGAIQPAMNLLSNLNYVAIAVIGGLRVSSGSMTLGDVQAFIQYSRQFGMPLSQLASMANVLQSGVVSAERVFEFLDAPEEVAETSTGEKGDALGRVEFRDVTFSYRADKPLIEHLSLVAEPGRTVAIVGPTGAGKTTLVNLLMRFYELQSGSILLDGRDIASMPRRELREQMGMVLQDAWLFGGTIRDNIRYGNPDATDAEVMAAAKATYVDRFVRTLPKGYDTVIDDSGSNVSAGERQLITIARAFLADPTILILDEATSSVDTRTEVLIQRAMAALRSRRTSFVIAHRLSTIRDADTILVMDAGRIVEQGSHAELIARGGAYFALYNSQFAAPVAAVA